MLTETIKKETNLLNFATMLDLENANNYESGFHRIIGENK